MNLATIRVGGTVACGPLITRHGPVATIRQDGRVVSGLILNGRKPK
jgi:hypothetical protein